MRIGVRTARTDGDVRAYAERAAFDGQTIRPFFNSLQGCTFRTLSPETRIFAEVCYERKLAYYVATALIECTMSSEGREKALDRVSSKCSTIEETWKPLIDHCAQLLRRLKMDATSARLSRLSSIWAASENGIHQTYRLKELVLHAYKNCPGCADRYMHDILDWIELYSIPSSRQVQHFLEAKQILSEDLARCDEIHVMIGNEEDAVRFYISTINQYSDCYVLLNWRGKEYNNMERHAEKRIVIGNLDYFTSKSRYRGCKTSLLILHAEQEFEDAFLKKVETRGLDDFLSELFVLSTITISHLGEIEECIRENEIIQQLIDSWPRENELFKDNDILNRLELFRHIECNSSEANKIWKDLWTDTESWIEKRMLKYKVPDALRPFVLQNCSNLVKSALLSHNLLLGEDYVVYSERSSGKLALRVRVRKQLNHDYGLLQFLEMRHGCEISPYKFTIGQADPFLRYEVMLKHARPNPFHKKKNGLQENSPVTYHSDASEFPTSVLQNVESLKEFNYLIVVVCCTNSLFENTLNNLKSSYPDLVVACETPLGVLQEAKKEKNKHSRAMVVCTTSACFEGWDFLPREKEFIKIIVSHHKMNNAALEVAGYLANSNEIMSFKIEISNKRIRDLYKRNFCNAYIWNEYKRTMEDGANERKINSHDINDLLETKRLLHKQLQHLITTAKIVHAHLSMEKLNTSDSPMDISCNGFLQQSVLKMDEVISKQRQVERLLTNHRDKSEFSYSISVAELNVISKRYMIQRLELSAFVSSTKKSVKPVTWINIRRAVESKFHLPLDADQHWMQCFPEQRSTSPKGATDEKTKEIVHNESNNISVIALNKECAAAATTFLLHLIRHPLPKDYRQWNLQCSDRNLEDCTMYLPGPGLNLEQLLKMEGATLERVFRCVEPSGIANYFKEHLRTETSEGLLESVVVESEAKRSPLYLFPRRCYDRLTRELFDNGLLVCDNYEELDTEMNEYDTIKLPVINEAKPRSPLDKILRAESALLEYGSLEWMQWFARRLKLSNYTPEAVQFYHRIIAEREYCVEDDRLLRQLEDKLKESQPGEPRRVLTSADQMKMDSFVFSTMDTIERGEINIQIAPPHRSNEALAQLTHFIRSRRIPPA